jgi:sulfur-carrier protein
MYSTEVPPSRARACTLCTLSAARDATHVARAMNAASARAGGRLGDAWFDMTRISPDLGARAEAWRAMRAVRGQRWYRTPVNVEVRVPGPLRSYTANASTVRARGETVAAVLQDLDRQFPGMRFRMIDERDCIRPHIRIFRERIEVRSIDEPVRSGETVQLLCALSGG